jgi:hypothetical protein
VSFLVVVVKLSNIIKVKKKLRLRKAGLATCMGVLRYTYEPESMAERNDIGNAG